MVTILYSHYIVRKAACKDNGSNVTYRLITLRFHLACLVLQIITSVITIVMYLMTYPSVAIDKRSVETQIMIYCCEVNF